MIAYLRGRVLDKQPNRITVDVQGVGYEVHVPLSTYYDVGEPGAEIALRIHTHVREESLQLFGFLTALEQQLFERLILEINQAGLSWLTILKKREAFRAAFRGFEVDRVARFGARDRERLLADAGIIRNRLKIDAVIEKLKLRDDDRYKRAQDITKAVVAHFGSPPESVMVQIVESSKDNKAKGGVLFSER